MDFRKGQSIENLIIPDEYLEEEVREGFYISGMMKRYWACQLKVLSEIAKVCKRHDINWYADCGSLIGAVRHGGYIPWDDDLDICMLRHDYNRFFEVAKDELPKEYFLLNISQTPDYEVMLGRVINSKVIDFGKEHLSEFFGCPYTVGVDIFPLDGVYEDKEKEEDRKKRANAVTAKIAGTPKGKERRDLYLQAEKIYSECPSETATNLAFMAFWAPYGNHLYPAEAYKNTIYMPFENTYIPVPAGYEQVLEIEYHDFMPVYKSGGIHDYPVFKEQEKILAKNLGHNHFRYTYSKEDLAAALGKKTFSEMCHERTDMLKQVPSQVEMLVKAGDTDNAAALLSGCQNIAITLGDLLEGKYEGEAFLAPAIKSLEEYCEAVYQSSLSWNDDSAKELAAVAEKILTALDKLLSEGRKEVLLIPVKAGWWSSMEPLYRHFLQEDGEVSYDIHVMPIPWHRKRNGEAAGDLVDETALFPEGLVTDSYPGYDPVKRHPDIIVTQFPYDSYDGAIGIPENFFAKNLVNNTDKLIYVPMLETEDPVATDDKLTAALEYFIEQPAVIYADKTVLYSSRIRTTYMDALAAMAGDETKKLWEDRIVVFEKEEVGKAEGRCFHVLEDTAWKKLVEGRNDRKLIVYCISAGFLSRYGEKALDKVKRSLNVFEEARDKVFTIVSPTLEVQQLETIDPELVNSFESIIRDYEGRGTCIYDTEGLASENIGCCDAFFGDRSHLARRCVELGIPVMIESIDV